jgi:hypothetical protein
MSVIDVFPKRPLQLTAVHARPTIWSLLVSCVGIGFLSFAIYSSTVSLVDDYRLRTATPAVRSHLTDGVCHMWLIEDCEYDANYTTRDGASLKRHVELMTVFQDPDEHMRFIVRYDPASPDHISTSWGVGLLLNRTITAFVGWLFLLSLIPSAVWMATNPRRLRRKMQAIGEQPTPVEVTFLKAYTPPRAQSATISYSWTDSMGQPKKASTELRGAREPFWLDAAKTRMLALVGPNGQSQLLDEKLALVSLTEQERARVMQERDRSLNAGMESRGMVQARA